MPKLYDLFDSDVVEVLGGAISSALSEAVLLAGPTGDIIWHNPMAVELLSMESTDLLGRQLDDERWHAITSDGDPFPLGEVREQLRESGSGLAGAPIGIRTGDSRLKWLNATVTPVDAAGQRHTIVVLNDVTDQISQQRSVKDTLASLRRSLAPADLPASDVVHFAAGRRDGGDSVVGADFYGVGVDGDMARFILGDSSGSGARAIQLGVTALTTMRAVSGLMPGPAAAMDRLDLVIDNDDPRFRVTAVAGRIETPYGIPTLSVVSAGHALPILIREGRATEIGSMSPMIGVRAREGRTATRHELRPGDIVIAYTDGLTECVEPRLSAEDLLDRIPVNVGVDAVIDTLMRMFDANPGADQGAAVFGFEVR